MFSFFSNPSISARIALTVAPEELFSPYCLLPPPRRESISSMKIIQGDDFLASAKSCLTLFAPTPTNISSKSEPEQKIKLQPASPAIALASNVLPVPGSPKRRTPLCSLAPFIQYLSGFLIIEIKSLTSSAISSIPLISSNLYSISSAFLKSNLESLSAIPMKSPNTFFS
jgi:hypothetical protein